MATSETFGIPRVFDSGLSELNELIRCADTFFSHATKASTPSLSGKSREVWKLAMIAASEGRIYNGRVRDMARYLLNGNSDTTEANGKTLETLLNSSSVRVPVCLKISAEANYKFASAGYDKNKGAMSKAARIHMTASAINYQAAYGEYSALEDSLKHSLPGFAEKVLSAWFGAHYLLATSAYRLVERMRKSAEPIDGKTDEESRANCQALLDEAAQNFQASLDVMYIARASGVVIPHVTAQVAIGVKEDLKRVTAMHGKTPASHAGTGRWTSGLAHTFRTVE